MADSSRASAPGAWYRRWRAIAGDLVVTPQGIDFVPGSIDETFGEVGFRLEAAEITELFVVPRSFPVVRRRLGVRRSDGGREVFWVPRVEETVHDFARVLSVPVSPDGRP